MKPQIILYFILISNIALGQLKDNFADGNVTNDPVWTGSNVDWQVNAANQLQLQAMEGGASYLSTPSFAINNATWEIWLQMDFNPSGSNYAQIFLAADQPDLTQTLNGYYVKIGDTEDEISLYYQEGNKSYKIIDGVDDRVDLDPVLLKIKVTRDKAGNWELLVNAGETDYVSEGTVFDDRMKQSAYFGIYAQYSKTRADKFYFDDIQVSGLPYQDNDPPLLKSVTVTSPEQITLHFSESLDPATAEDYSNYTIDQGIEQPQTAQLSGSNDANVMLQFSSPLQDANFYNITIENISDFNGNQIDPITEEFFYYEDKVAQTLHVVINEFLPDPSPVVSLPEEEFIELYNDSDFTYNLKNWQITDNSTTGTLDSVILFPDQYLILVPEGNLSDFESYGNVLEISSWPSLNNGGDALYLTDNTGTIIDSVIYNAQTYQDETKAGGGWSLERIFPGLTCQSVHNWLASNNADGGTPGTINSVFSETPDVQAPMISGTEVISDNQISVNFSESMDEASLSAANYQLQPTNTIQNVKVAEDFQSVTLALMQPLTPGEDITITIDNATDCMGNLLEQNVAQIIYDITPPQWQEVIFTSNTELTLLFSESLLPDSALQVQNYLLNQTIYPQNTDLPAPDQVKLTFAQAYNEPEEQVLTIQNITDLNGNIIPATEQIPFNYQDQIDTILIKGENHIAIIFKEQPDPSAAELLNNYQVNQKTSPTATFIDEQNDHMYHLIFTNSFLHGEWFDLYIKNIFNAAGERIATPARSFYFDNQGPEIEQLKVQNDNQLFIKFDEKIDPVSAAVLVNYEINKSIGYPESLTIENDSAVSLFFKNNFAQNTKYQLEINNVKDAFGNGNSNEKESFVFDLSTPEIISWRLLYPGKLTIRFSESLDPATIVNENFLLNGSPIPDAKINLVAFDFSQVIIHFDFLEDDTDHELTINNLKDENGNALSQSLMLSFSTRTPIPGEVKVLNDSTIEVGFSEILDSGEAANQENYLLNSAHLPIEVIYLQHKVQLVFDQHFSPLDSQRITFINLTDLNGNARSDYTSYFIYKDFVEKILIENENTLNVTFELVVDVASLNEDLFHISTLGNPFLILPVNNNEKSVKLIFNSQFQDGKAYTLTIENFYSAFEIIIPASRHQLSYDVTPPQIVDLKMEFPRQLQLKFSEAVDESSVDEEYFEVKNFGPPQKVEVDSDLVTLYFNNNFTDQQEYVLTINALQDVSGNQLVNYDYPFTYKMPRQASFNDLIITEIMAEPSPPRDVPETEYLEIFNRSTYDLPVNDLIISDGSRQGKIEDAIIPAGEYAILCANNDKSLFQTYGVAIGVTSMPGLNNDGETLTLSHTGGDIIFSVTYNQSWYKDLNKANGGWSLEMIDTENPCGGSHNWSGSENPAGGTPAEENSVKQPNPDNLGPQLLQATATNATTIWITFNEKMDYDRLQQIQISSEPEILIADMELDQQLNQIKIDLQQPLKAKQPYKLSVTTAWDCMGNPLAEDHNQAVIVLPEPAEANDLVINEILFNPRSGGVEFIELYNNSDKNILLQDVNLATSTDFKNLEMKPVIISPGNYLVLTESASILKSDYPDAPVANLISANNLPTLNNQESSVILWLNDVKLDSVYYHNSFHFALIKDDKGVSLERIYSDQPAYDENNWQSAVAQVGFATPGKVNSQSRPEVALEGTITAEPPTFAPGDPGGRSFTSINYQFEEPGKLATLTIHDITGRVLRTLVQNETLASSGSFIWDGVTDEGQQVRFGAYLVVMEVYDLEGNLEIYKERVAVGGNF